MVAEIATIAALLGIVVDVTGRTVDPAKLQDLVIDMVDQVNLLGETEDTNQRIVVTKNILEIAKALLEVVQRDPSHGANKVGAELAFLAWHLNSQELALWAGMNLKTKRDAKRKLVEPKHILEKLSELAAFGLSVPSGAAASRGKGKSIQGKRVAVLGNIFDESGAPLTRDGVRAKIEESGATYTPQIGEAQIIIIGERTSLVEKRLAGAPESTDVVLYDEVEFVK